MSEYGAYSLADVAGQVMARDARCFRRDSLPLAGDDVVVRSWRVDKHLQERVRSFLDRYGDGDHYVVTPPATTAPEVHAIVNPAVDDGVTMAGTFRVVRNFEDPQFAGMVFQELRRGWLTALVSGGTGAEVIDWTEARLVLGDVGSSLPGPTGAGANLTTRRRVVKISWPCVCPTARNAVVEALMALSPTHTALASPLASGESLGSGWVRLGASSRLGDDGAAVVELVLAQSESVTEGFSAVGTMRESRDTTVSGVPAHLAQSYIDAWRPYGALKSAGATPRGGSASASVDPDSGLATLRFQWKPLTASPGAVIMGVWKNAQNWQLHFIAWNQSAANLATYVAENPIGLNNDNHRVALGGEATWKANVGGFTTGMVTAGEWSLARFDFDDETQRYQWHVIIRQGAPESMLDGRISFTVQVKTRRMWDNENRVWVPQFCMYQFGHHHRLFTAYQDAWDFRAYSATYDTPLPRLVGDSWLSIRTYVQYCSGWVDDERQDATYGAMVTPAGYNAVRFGDVPVYVPPDV